MKLFSVFSFILLIPFVFNNVYAAKAKPFYIKSNLSGCMENCVIIKDDNNLRAIDSNVIPGFKTSPYFNEQILSFRIEPEVNVLINAPSKEQFDQSKKVMLILYALPNGNTIPQTIGRKIKPGDDWHFDIQHIGAQTRFLRNKINDANTVTAYLETDQKSWPAWRGKYSNNALLIKKIVDSLKSIFKTYETSVTLTGHSGGGSFIFGFMNAYESLPDFVDRIVFLDSDYAYNDSLHHGRKLTDWLHASEKNYLCVIAYNDSVALLNGKHFVSPTGGTWYRSKLMKRSLEKNFAFSEENSEQFQIYKALSGRISFILKENPGQKIFHTVQVELNGFIHGILSGTSLEGSGYSYFGQRAYDEWIEDSSANSSGQTVPD